MMVLMSDEAAVLEIPDDDPRAVELVLAICGGDTETVRRHLAADPGLARAVIGDRKGCRTLLHVIADWPGYFPSGPELVHLLIGAGADPRFRDPARCDETALHWAASSDDADVAAALIDGGADLDVPGGSIGTPLANAVGYGCWHVARLLIARGARIGSLWEAAALGDWAAVDGFLEGDPPPGSGEIDAPSGRPATAVSAGWPSTCWPGAPTSTRSPITRGSRPHSGPRARLTRSARSSSTG
jgi:hypothetical protein